MDLKLSPSSRAFVEVRSKGILGALEHTVVFTSPLAPAAIANVPESGAVDVPVEARLEVAQIAPPEGASRFDRDKMTDNLRGDETLDMKRWPTIDFRGRYAGTLERGSLRGDLVVRGAPRAVDFDVRVTKTKGGYRADASWEGTLTQLGIKPFKALFGALKLHDFCRIRLQVDFSL